MAPVGHPKPGRFRRSLATTLFVVLGLVAAFVVSAVAGLWDDEPAATGLRTLGVDVDDRSATRVEVLNGAGTPGLARDATRRLREAGFDVVFFGNADHFQHARSVVIDRGGDRALARAVATALALDSVATAVDASLMLEVTVILGRDWPPAPQPEHDWSDRLRDAVRPDTTRPDRDRGD